MPDYYDAERFGGMPDAVEIAVWPDDALAAPDLEEVEFAVPPYRTDEVLRALPRMRGLRVLQADSAAALIREQIQRHLDGRPLLNVVD